MRTLLDEILTSLRNIGNSPESATRIVGLMLLGVTLNLAALQAVDSLRPKTHSHPRLSPISEVARMDISMVRIFVTRVISRISDGEHRPSGSVGRHADAAPGCESLACAGRDGNNLYASNPISRCAG